MNLQRSIVQKNLACDAWIGGHLIIAIMWLALSAIAFGNDEITSGELRSTSADVARLIEQLGADSFSQRERASKKLLARGLHAYADLQNAENHSDRETRMRVRRLLLNLVEIDRQTQLSEFITNMERDFEQLPSWIRLREIVGDTRAARMLMAGVLRDNWDVLAESERDANSAEATLARRCEELQYSRSVQRRQLNREDIAALLLLAVNPKVGVYQQTQQKIYNLCYRIHFADNQSGGVSITDDDPLRKLLGAWVARPSDVANTAFYSLNLALRCSLAGGLVPAVQVLEENNAAPYIRQYAILTVARFENHQSVPLLKTLLDDESVCYSQTDPKTKNIAFQSQVRDVALAILLYLDGHDPKDFGFEKRRPSTNMVYQPNTLGFGNDELRAAAFDAWKVLDAAKIEETIAAESLSES